MTYYLLDGQTPVPCDDLLVWARTFGTNDFHVARTTAGEVSVSTIFLGVNQSVGSSEPILFETRIFGGVLDGEMERYATWDEAVDGHARMVTRVQQQPAEAGEETT